VDGYMHPGVVVSGADPSAEQEAAERDLLHHARALPPGSTEIATRRDAEPARGILAFADDHHVDVIVVGTHSRRAIERMLLGSVADKVVRGADCSVLVVPP
jgi:nucleotide-binding universal stress UspA family protein